MNYDILGHAIVTLTCLPSLCASRPFYIARAYTYDAVLGKRTQESYYTTGTSGTRIDQNMTYSYAGELTGMSNSTYGSVLSSIANTFASLPFGDGYTPTGTDPDPSHFAMLDHDAESNTDHAQARQYNSTPGTWMSPDPYDGSYDQTNPQSFNRYVYAGNNPLMYVDPSGLDWTWVCTNPAAPGANAQTGPQQAVCTLVETESVTVYADPDLPCYTDASCSPSTTSTPDNNLLALNGAPPYPGPGAPNNGRNCSAGPASAGQYIAASAEMATLTSQWASGLGPSNRTFGPDTATSAVMGQSAGVQEVLGAYMFTGQTSGLYTFGPSGAYVAGGNPVAQVIGSFRWSISSGVLSLTNTMSLRSFTYDHGPQYQRGNFPTPAGNTHQTIQIGVVCQ